MKKVLISDMNRLKTLIDLLEMRDEDVSVLVGKGFVIVEEKMKALDSGDYELAAEMRQQEIKILKEVLKLLVSKDVVVDGMLQVELLVGSGV